MIDLKDYELDRSEEAPITPPPPRSRNYAVWATVIVAALVVGVGVWYVVSRWSAPPAVAVKVPAAAPATVTPSADAPMIEAAELDLPPLSQTDAIVRELVTRLSSHPTIAAWLTTDGLVANFTMVTLTIAEGRTPTKSLRPIAPRGSFRATSSAGRLLVDPRSYDRYNPHADAIAALDPAGTARLYLSLKPRITDAYRELGYPEGDFDRVLERAMGVLLKTPALDGPVAIAPKGALYKYNDPRLESLSQAQKQLLRLGPRNSQAIRAKLEEVAALLKLKPS